MGADFDIESSGLLDGLEGAARAERAELIPWLLEHGVTVQQIRESYAPVLLASRRMLGDSVVPRVTRRKFVCPTATAPVAPIASQP